jgi:hypothetical protein
VIARAGTVVSSSLVAVGLLVGCGSTESAADPISAVAETMAGQGSVRTRTVVKTEIVGKPQTLVSEGIVDFRTGDSMSTSNGFAGMSSKEVRVVDGVTYSTIDPSVAQELQGTTGSAPAAGTFWLRADFGAAQEVVAAMSVTKILDRLRAVTDAEVLGTTELRGADVTHYRLTLSPSKQRAHEKDIPTGKLKELTSSVEVWVDGADRLRQLAMNDREGGAPFSLVEEFYDFGVPVDIQPPPADQVVDLGSLAPEPDEAEPAETGR